MTARLIVIFIGCALGNFAYQAINDQNWLTAFDRSFFQGAALLLAAVLTSKAEG